MGTEYRKYCDKCNNYCDNLIDVYFQNETHKELCPECYKQFQKKIDQIIKWLNESKFN